MASVVLENVSKLFTGPRGEEVRAVQDFSLAVEAGQLAVVVGPSGCGKTTTLRLIAGLEKPSGGAIAIDGRLVNQVEPRDREVAMVFQNYALYPHLTAYENLAFGLKLRKYPKTEIDHRVRETAEALELTPCLDRLPSALSGGQRQRVAVGRALVRQPKVFLFDEPLSNLDPPMRAQMRLEIAKLHRRLAATMIYVTHDQAEAMMLGQRIAVMKDGRLQQVAPPLGLYHRPENLFVAGFIGTPTMNLIRGEVRPGAGGPWFHGPAAANRPALALQVAPRHADRFGPLVGRALVLGLRPEDVITPVSAPEASNVVTATVDLVEPLGADTFLRLSIGATLLVARVHPGQAVSVGQTVPLHLDLAKAHYFDVDSGQAL